MDELIEEDSPEKSHAKEVISDLFEKHGGNVIQKAYCEIIDSPHNCFLQNLTSVEDIQGESENIVDIDHFTFEFDKFLTEYTKKFVVPKLDQTALINIIDICIDLYGLDESEWTEFTDRLEEYISNSA